VVEPKSAILLVYIVAEQSGSVGRNIDGLNAGLASLRDALQRESSAAANVRLSVIGFSDTAFTYLEPADVRVLQGMPVLTAQNRSSYAAAFDQLAHRIAVDIPSLEAQGHTVHQPAVFFVTDGLPDGDQDWRSVRASLLDEPAAPAILAFGIGNADEAVISDFATKPYFAFVSARGVDGGAAISELLASVTQSLISSGQAIASGSAGLSVEKPEGFTFAGDAPTPDRPPISAREIPGTPKATQATFTAKGPSVTTKGPSEQRQGGFVLAGLALLAIALQAVDQVVMQPILMPLEILLVSVATVTIVLIVGVTIAVRSGQSHARTGIFVIAMIAGLVAVPWVFRFAQGPRTAPPVAQGALDSLLLSPDQINTTMGVTGMVLADTTTMNDSSARTSDEACVVMYGAGEATVYANSGWTATRLRTVGKSLQVVVLFSSAHDASAFFTVSGQRWPGCSNRQFTGGSDTFTVGPVSNAYGTLSASITGNASFHCERALTVANNVAIDIATCGVPGSAVNIAHQIAAKITR
jgi:uncharacterized protein YegL